MGTIPGEARSWSRTLPAGPTSAAEARGFLWEALKDQDVSLDLDAAALLTTEIASNAARHGKEPIRVSVTLEKEGLRVSVHDQGPGFDPNEAAALGTAYGVTLVRQLASEWGVERGAEGTEVWFRI